MLRQFLFQNTLVRRDVVQDVLRVELFRFLARGRGDVYYREDGHRRDAQLEQVRRLQKRERLVVYHLLLEGR